MIGWLQYWRRLSRRLRPIELIVMRLADMTVLHPDQDESRLCSKCRRQVAIYPSGQEVLRRHPDAIIVCQVCAGPVDPSANLAPGALAEPFQSLEEEPMNDSLRHAMNAADLEAVAEEIGIVAVQTALAVQAPDRREAEARAKAEAETQRQRDLDAADADTIEIVNRHRTRLGRRVCSRHDAMIRRQIFELLRSMAGPDGGADQDPSFPQ